MNYPVPMSTPKENAQYLDNSRLNKFISEFQQMINRAMYLYGATDDQLLKRVNGKTYGVKGHPHHPLVHYGFNITEVTLYTPVVVFWSLLTNTGIVAVEVTAMSMTI